MVSEIIEKAIIENKVILCDRFIDSTIAYQGYGRGLDVDKLINLNSFATKEIYPDLTFIFDIDINTSFERLEKIDNDRMESSGKEFFTNVRNGYIKISKTNKRYKLIDCCLKSPEQINTQVVDVINDFYKGELHI